MSLRCKAGDLAYDLGPIKEHYGKIVDVIEYLGDRTTVDGIFVKDAWVIEAEFLDDGWQWVSADSNLLPIRPDELKEEQEKEVTA